MIITTITTILISWYKSDVEKEVWSAVPLYTGRTWIIQYILTAGSNPFNIKMFPKLYLIPRSEPQR